MYTIFLWCAFPFVLLRTIYLGAKNDGIQYFCQRFGLRYSISSHKNPIWFHCASVGETKAVIPLILYIRRKLADAHILVTTNTWTGKQIIKQELPFANHVYLPLDYNLCVNKFLNFFQPRCAVITETEIWLTLYKRCNKNNIPVVIVNARLTKNSSNTNYLVKSYYQTALRYVSRILARSREDAAAFCSLGADINKVQVIGNIKYARTVHQLDAANSFHCDRPYLLAASTHDNEEMLLTRLVSLLKQHGYLLVIAPRYPERARSLQSVFASFKVAMRSKQQPVNRDTDIYLVDTLGELNQFFQNATIVFVGGSLVPKGGHNILEPAQYGACILVGPYTDNFRNECTEFINEEALVQVGSLDELEIEITQLIQDPYKRKKLGENAKKLLNNNSDILDKYYSSLCSYLEV